MREERKKGGGILMVSRRSEWMPIRSRIRWLRGGEGVCG